MVTLQLSPCHGGGCPCCADSSCSLGSSILCLAISLMCLLRASSVSGLCIGHQQKRKPEPCFVGSVFSCIPLSACCVGVWTSVTSTVKGSSVSISSLQEEVLQHQ